MVLQIQYRNSQAIFSSMVNICTCPDIKPPLIFKPDILFQYKQERYKRYQLKNKSGYILFALIFFKKSILYLIYTTYVNIDNINMLLCLAWSQKLTNFDFFSPKYVNCFSKCFVKMHAHSICVVPKENSALIEKSSIFFGVLRFSFNTIGVTNQQRMLTPLWHLLLPPIIFLRSVFFCSCFVFSLWTFEIEHCSISPHSIFNQRQENILFTDAF